MNPASDNLHFWTLADWKRLQERVKKLLNHSMREDYDQTNP